MLPSGSTCCFEPVLTGAIVTATEWIPVQTYITGLQYMNEAKVRWLFQQLMLAVDYCHGKCMPLYVLLMCYT
jgi:hypothetical protein